MTDKQENRPASDQVQPQNRQQERKNEPVYTEGRQGRSNRKRRGGRVQDTRDRNKEGQKERSNPSQNKRSGQAQAGNQAGTQAGGSGKRESIKGQAGQRQPRSRNRKHVVADETKAKRGDQLNQTRSNRNKNRSDNRADSRANNRNRLKQQSYNYQKESKMAETLDDIKRDNDRIEKEIWLEIADIHTIKLDF